MLSYTDIRAPFSGRINRIPHKIGSLIEQGTLLTQLSKDDEVFVYFDISEKREIIRNPKVQLLRIEQLYPFPVKKLASFLKRFKNADEFIWCQEEPENMGAWSFMLQRFKLVNLEVASQPVRAVPAAGSSARFKRRRTLCRAT